MSFFNTQKEYDDYNIKCVEMYYSWTRRKYPKWLYNKQLPRFKSNLLSPLKIEVAWPGRIPEDSRMQRGEYFSWIIDNCSGEWYYSFGIFYFEFESDAIAFKLRWQR